MDETKTFGQKWLINEFVLSFWVIKKYAKAQSQLDTIIKTILSHSNSLKMSRLYENFKSFFT